MAHVPVGGGQRLAGRVPGSKLAVTRAAEPCAVDLRRERAPVPRAAPVAERASQRPTWAPVRVERPVRPQGSAAERRAHPRARAAVPGALGQVDALLSPPRDRRCVTPCRRGCRVWRARRQRQSVARGPKVSPAPPDAQRTHLICVYVNDYMDRENVLRVRETLRRMGATNRLMFKADAYTHLDIYQGNKWGIHASVYAD